MAAVEEVDSGQQTADSERAVQQNKRGGGPRTAAGRAVVRRNPIKHGVLAQTPVIELVERA